MKRIRRRQRQIPVPKRHQRHAETTIHYAFASRPLCGLLQATRGLNQVTCPQCLRIIGQILSTSQPAATGQSEPPPKILREIGRRIQIIREEKRLTRLALSRACGVSRSHLYKIELGDHNITLRYLVRIVAALDTTLEALLAGVE